MNENTSKILPEEVKIEIINGKHNVTNFNSYEQDLVDFLKDDALENQEQNLSVTFLLFYQNQLVSYLTLLTDRITLEGNLQKYFREKGVHYKSLPALKIGRLCVDDNFRRRGLGKLMIEFSIMIAKEINQGKAGCRFIAVDVKRNSALELDSFHFYKKLGFEITREKVNRKITFMHLDVKLA